MARCRILSPVTPSLVHALPSVVEKRPCLATPAMTRPVHGSAEIIVRLPHSDVRPASVPVMLAQVAAGAAAVGAAHVMTTGFAAGAVVPHVPLAGGSICAAAEPPAPVMAVPPVPEPPVPEPP